MLRHLGLMENAAVIENALLYTLEQGVHTGDFGDKNTPALNTTARLLPRRSSPILGSNPRIWPNRCCPACSVTQTAFRLSRNEMMVTKETQQEVIVGVDLFIGSSGQPDFIAKKCQRHAYGVKFNLINISNRGTQVWPTGSIYTNLVNQYNVRFESIDGSPLNQQDVLGLYVSLSGDFKICSSELLNMWGEKKAYSLAQGRPV